MRAVEKIFYKISKIKKKKTIEIGQFSKKIIFLTFKKKLIK